MMLMLESQYLCPRSLGCIESWVKEPQPEGTQGDEYSASIQTALR